MRHGLLPPLLAIAPVAVVGRDENVLKHVGVEGVSAVPSSALLESPEHAWQMRCCVGSASVSQSMNEPEAMCCPVKSASGTRRIEKRREEVGVLGMDAR